jgi:HK97 gp10 family phage protein
MIKFNTNKIIKRVEQIAHNALQATGKEMKADAEVYCPVGTGAGAGFLKSTIFEKMIEPLKMQMGATAVYTIYVEMGTSKSPAQPFIRPSYDKNKRNLLTHMRNKL